MSRSRARERPRTAWLARHTWPGAAREGPSVEITVRHTWPGAARQGPSVEITVTLPLHHVAPLSTSPCSAVYHPAVYPPMPRCLPPHAPLSITPCPAVLVARFDSWSSPRLTPASFQVWCFCDLRERASWSTALQGLFLSHPPAPKILVRECSDWD